MLPHPTAVLCTGTFFSRDSRPGDYEWPNNTNRLLPWMFNHLTDLTRDDYPGIPSNARPSTLGDALLLQLTDGSYLFTKAIAGDNSLSWFQVNTDGSLNLYVSTLGTDRLEHSRPAHVDIYYHFEDTSTPVTESQASVPAVPARRITPTSKAMMRLRLDMLVLLLCYVAVAPNVTGTIASVDPFVFHTRVRAGNVASFALDAAEIIACALSPGCLPGTPIWLL